MMIDISAIQLLEVAQNYRDPKSKGCLFGLLNNTITPMGARMLRNNMIQPPTRYDTFIAPRYDAVEELVESRDVLQNLRQGRTAGYVVKLTVPGLKPFQDVEKLLTKVCQRA